MLLFYKKICIYFYVAIYVLYNKDTYLNLLFFPTIAETKTFFEYGNTADPFVTTQARTK